MSSGHRDDRPALVVLGLLVASLLIVSAIGLVSRYTANYPAYRGSQYANQAGNPDVAAITGAIMDFNPWDDTFAQWAMALSGIVATAASVGALFYLRHTLIETRRIGQAQIRAYLGIKSIRVIRNDDAFPGKKGFWLNVEVANTGQSPARDVTLSFSLDNRLHASKPRQGIDHYNKRRFFLGAQLTHFEEVGVSLAVGEHKALFVDTGKNSDPPDQNTAVFLEGALAYTDCFDVRRSFEWSYYFTGEFSFGGYRSESYMYRGKDTSFLGYKYATQEQIIGQHQSR